MKAILRYAGQACVYAAIAVLIGWLASRPRIVAFPPDAAQIKLSFAHGAERREACRRLTPDEISKLPPRERRPNTCGRERLPIHMQLLLDDRVLLDAVLPPTGLSKDGPALVYHKFVVTPGRHVITARLADTGRAEGFDYESRVEKDLAPLQSLAIDFHGDLGKFSFR